VAIWGVAALLLLLPAVAMRFTPEVNWSPPDFGVFGAMLFAACGTYELAARRTVSTAYRAGVGVAVAAGFLLVWINLAVGILGSEANPANLMFGGVLGVALVGALFARFRPEGMARALVGTAIAQGLVQGIALAAGWGSAWILTGFFVVLWLTSAQLFRRAAREQAGPGTQG